MTTDLKHTRSRIAKAVRKRKYAPPKKENAHITIQLAPEEKTRFQKNAEKLGMTMTAYLKFLNESAEEEI